MAEVEGLGASVGVRGVVEVFGWAQQPEEGDDDEVDGGAVECAFDGMVGVQGIDEALEDGDVGRVGSFGRFIFISEGLDKSSEYGMEPVGVRALLAGIEATQVGDPLAHGQERFLDCISPDRVIGLSVASVAEGEDEEVSQLGFVVRDVTEGRQSAEVAAEAGPVVEDGVLGTSGLGRGSCGGALQRSAEISREETSLGSCSSVQGRDCG